MRHERQARRADPDLGDLQPNVPDWPQVARAKARWQLNYLGDVWAAASAGSLT